MLKLITLVALAAAPALGASPFSYRYFKQPRALTLDAGRVAVFGGLGDRSALAVRGLEGVADAQLPIPGLTLARVAAEARDPLSVQALVGEAARASDAGFVSPVFVGEDGGPLIVTREVLVGFAEDLTPAQARAVLAEMIEGDLIDEAVGDSPNVFRVRAHARNGFDVLAAANALADHPEVRFAEPDMIFTGRGALIPNDPNFPDAWAFQNTAQFGGVPGQDMNAPAAWDITTGSNAIITVVIDTGVDPAHPDLNLRLPGGDATGGSGQGAPGNACDNHGTPVAGNISGTINNNLGSSGLAPATRVASSRAFISSLACDGSWTSQASWTVGALSFAQFISARVTNNSNYYGFTSSSIADKYASTKTAGIVHFASAGNNGTGTISYPSSLPSVNAVAALDPNGLRVGFSQFGTGLDFSAPGVSIHSTDRVGGSGYSANDYAFVSGTSFASPLTAAVAALLLSYQSTLTPAQVERAMQQGARNIGAAGYDTGSGWGFVDAFRSLERVRCPADLSFDSVVDDADFLAFAVSYDVLLCTAPAMPLVCSADINADNVVDDVDFVLFAAAYDALLCP
ncbi:MAG TPA: S8 family serine peptidase [Phycisphaerales bacterium]